MKIITLRHVFNWISRLVSLAATFLLAFYLTKIVLDVTIARKYVYPDQLVVILFLFVFANQKKRLLRTFLIDWFPFLTFLVLYDMMRGVAPQLYKNVHVIEPYQWEVLYFGWMANGEAPTLVLQSWRASISGGLKQLVDLISGASYITMFLAPILVMWLIWWKLRDRRNFYHMSWTLGILNYMALATFFFYPAAPPWYFMAFGNTPPALTFYGHAAAGLLDVDRLLHINVFSTIWSSINPNYFAAVPSLHGAWPVVVAIYSVKAFGRKASFVWVYPFLVAFAGMYFNHHYIVDYVIGWIYLAVAFFIMDRFLMPKLFDRLVNYRRLRRSRIKKPSS